MFIAGKKRREIRIRRPPHESRHVDLTVEDMTEP
jgi:hypothetical protein